MRQPDSVQHPHSLSVFPFGAPWPCVESVQEMAAAAGEWEAPARALRALTWLGQEFVSDWEAQDLRAALFQLLLLWLLVSLLGIQVAWRVYGNTVTGLYYRQGRSPVQSSPVQSSSVLLLTTTTPPPFRPSDRRFGGMVWLACRSSRPLLLARSSLPELPTQRDICVHGSPFVKRVAVTT